MTSSDLTPAAHPLAERTRAAFVTAILVTRGSTPYLSHSLDAVFASTVEPAGVVVVDVSTDSSATLSAEVADRVTLVRAPGARTFGAAITDALDVVGRSATTPWMWLLHDDSAPEPQALHHLVRALEHTSSVAIAGSKQVRWHAPDELVEVGYTVSRSGRRMTGVEPGELDQGQHDSREDVLAVGLAGALVRRSVWDDLGGTDPVYGSFGDGLDLCRRARLAGHRVVVVPRAIVLHAQAGLSGLRDAVPTDDDAPDALPAAEDQTDAVDPTFGARLRSQLYFLGTSIRVWLLPFFLVGSVLAGPVRALYRIAVKQPGHAVDELWSPLWLLARTGKIIGARRSAAATSVAPRSLLVPLMATTRDVLEGHRDRRLALAALRKAAHAPNELDRAEIRSAARHRAAGLGGVLLVALVVTVLALGPVLRTLVDGGRIVGGALLPASGGFADLWQAITGGWIRDGLGASAPADPLLTALAPATILARGDLQLAVNVLLVSMLVLAGAGAWFAAGAATRSVPIRLWAGLVWVAAPALLVGLGDGRLGAVLAHATLPWFALSLARALGIQATDSWGVLRMRSAERTEQRVREKTQERLAQRAEARGASGIPVGRVSLRSQPAGPVRPHGSVAALGAAGLTFAIVVAGAPVLLLPGLVAMLVVLVVAPRHRRYVLFVPLPALVIVGPLLVRTAATWSSGGWRILFGDPGLPLASDAAEPWQQLFALPAVPSSFFTADGAWGVVGEIAPYALGATVLVTALVGLARSGARGAAARVLWCIVPLGLATAVLSAAIVVDGGTTSAVTGWSGPGSSLLLLALLGAGALGIDGLAAKAMTHTFGWRQLGIGLLALVIGLVPLAGLAAWGGASRSDDSPVALQSLDRAIVPAVGQQLQTSGRQARVLVLETADDGSIAYQLLHEDGPQLTDSSTVVNVTHLAGHADPAAELVAAVSSGVEGDQAGALAELGVGAVLVPPSDQLARAQLVGRIDTVVGLQRITENESGTIWRVMPVDAVTEAVQPAWARIYSPDPDGALVVEQAVEAGRLSVDTTVAPGEPDRVLVLAENAAPGWTARLDGVPLRSLEDGARQAFALGGEGGHLVVGYERASRTPWIVLQGVVLVVFALLALPVRRRRGGGR
ncbi:glycosyltransferase [Sanguibacter antarcticus]|uniref:GT2 family glycosyltransferase n=1 Tax=Sanguibacter antarcticus TaxID=372484 RepID=A0A2A9E121_9MICO|nr:glycosyltransferase [Sanguibacter antarcticus]PFG32543.1 GT2 family glycosyltransferase [Sanguibacter antarcticus]